MNQKSNIQNPTPIIDTHSHLNFHAFKKDADAVMQKTLAQDIWMINVGTKYETSQKAVEIAEHYDKGVYAAIGLHPMFAGAEFLKVRTDPDEGEFLLKEQDFDKEKYRQLALSGAEGSKKSSSHRRGGTGLLLQTQDRRKINPI